MRRNLTDLPRFPIYATITWLIFLTIGLWEVIFNA